MTTQAKIGWGSEFHLDNDAGVSTEIAEILTVMPPSSSADTVEVTHMKSPERFREYIAGLKDGSEADITMNLAPGSASDLLCMAAIGERRDCKIVIPTTTGTWESNAVVIVTNYQRETPIDDRMTATLSVKFTGPSTEAAGA